MAIIQTRTAEDFQSVAAALLPVINKQPEDAAAVIALSGELGAGKTTLTQSLAEALGVTETVSSPTYVVMKRYELPENISRYQTLLHIDAYRIEDIDEMRVLGFAELLKQKDTIMCIEWPEKIAALIPPTAIRVAIEHAGDGRTVTIS